MIIYKIFAFVVPTSLNFPRTINVEYFVLSGFNEKMLSKVPYIDESKKVD